MLIQKLRGSVKVIVPETTSQVTLDSASEFIRKSFSSVEESPVLGESLIEASLQDRETQTHISSQNQLEQKSLTEKQNDYHSSPITSVSETDEDDDFADSGYNPVIIIKCLPPYSALPSYQRNRCLLPPKSADSPPYTLILDLDETLVHCSMEKIGNPDLTFSIRLDGEKYRVYANIRPFLFYLLKRIYPYYEIIVFTASQQCYADRILDILDSENHLISHRLYRDDCLFINNNYIKDLNVLNRDLSKTVIVDNYISCFGYHIENGIPIISWFDDKSDHELYNLSTVLLSFLSKEDIRPSIEELFHLKKTLSEFEIVF